MANSMIQLMHDVGETTMPLSGSSLVATGEISTPPANVGNVFFIGIDGQEVPWIPGEYHRVVSVDLSEIMVHGTVGDKVTFVGGTWSN